ncbi:(deoxy)nucleoside triphosphate pyrophosphohydrolase [Actinotalea sp. K2]|uniref:(deoxy)nucleoside triphosphate pyrophosphohydrolase n=1 Tax=Actinotalea sp. K2 TaxID=2939438 RepID=UPI0020174385|nr:(deoxy)nucleoside triphosphate pyrophosphohydrolase [Actinotalea sp. K2]MCL3860926.1 (deoxy)nucleoside triphosphate pyrophosphohydrolase [Actinotalea sp. K2]
MSRPERPVTVVAAALVDDLHAPRLLLAARRHKPTRLAGRWEFPGGKVDPGETPERALHREIAEELGVRIALGDEITAPGGGPWPISSRYVLRVWTATVREGRPHPLVEHDELRWLGPGEWFDVAWLDADVPIVGALLAGRRSPAAAPRVPSEHGHEPDPVH